MKQRATLIVLSLMVFLSVKISAQDQQNRPNELYVDFQIPIEQVIEMLELDDEFLGDFSILNVKRAFKTKSPSLENLALVTIADPSERSRIIEFLNNHPQVSFAEAIPNYSFFYTPNDLTLNQYNLSIVQAENAWDISTGNASIAIAVVDDAFRMDHDDLQGAWYTNPNEIPGNGIDDDANGFVDDIQGWDAADSDPDANPPMFSSATWTHGTHVAGIASGSTDNGTGVAAMGFNTRMIPVKSTNTDAFVSHAYEGVDYAINSGAQIISMSWGGPTWSATGEALMNAANANGIVLVAAAGNSNVSAPMYPASFNNVISVAATDQNDVRASFSNYGATIDVCAPGVDIPSCLAGNASDYGDLSGTSMACPLVSGIISLMLSEVPTLTPQEIEDCLESTCDDIDSMNGGFIGDLGAGRVNAEMALACVSSVYAAFEGSPLPVCPGSSVQFTDLSYNGPLTWDWNFPGGNPTSSNIQNPIIQYDNPGVYDVTLSVSNQDGSHSATYTDYVVVGYPEANLSGSTIITEGSDTWLVINFSGAPPFDVVISDGTNDTVLNGIMTSPYQFQVFPSTTTSYTIDSFTTTSCQGVITGGATVTVVPAPSPSQCYFSNFYGDALLNTFGMSFSDPIDNSFHSGLNHDGGGFLSHINVDGSLDFVKEYSYVGVTRGLVRAPNGDQISVSSPNSNYAVMRTDAQGNVIWAKEYDWSNDRYPQIIQSTGDTYIVSGWTTSLGVSDNVMIMKIDGNGDVIWEMVYDSVDDQMSYITEDGNGGCIIGGGLHIFGGNLNFFLLHLDTDGNLVNKKEFDSSPIRDDNPDVKYLSDGSYAVSGSIETNGVLHTFVSKLDSDMNHLWSYQIDGTPVEDESSSGVDEDGDGNIYFFLRLNENAQYIHKVLKFSSNGTLLSAKRGDDMFYSRFQYNDVNGSDSWIIEGSSITFEPFGNRDAFYIHTDVDMNTCMLVDDNQTITPISWTDTNWSGTQAISNANINDVTNQVSVSTVNWEWMEQCTVECTDPCEIEVDFLMSDSVLCSAGSIDFTSLVSVADSLWWTIDGVEFSTDSLADYSFANEGVYEITLLASLDSCYAFHSQNVMVNLLDLDAGADVLMCLGDSASLEASGDILNGVIWSPIAGLSDPYVYNPNASPSSSTYYVATIEDAMGCQKSDTLLVEIDTSCCQSWISFDYESQYCEGEVVSLENNSISFGGTTLNVDYSPDFELISQTGNDYILDPQTTGVLEVFVDLTDDCGTISDTLEILVFPNPIANAGADTLVCSEGPHVLGVSPITFHSYNWSPSDWLDDASLAQPTVNLTEDMSFVMEITDNNTGCSAIDSVNIFLNQPLDLGDDYVGCIGDTLYLGPNVFADNIAWGDGSVEELLEITESGVYEVTISNSCGDQTDFVSIWLEDCTCPIYVPNAFSPNLDDKNEVFLPVINCSLSKFNFEIWNRWGERVFTSNDPELGWIGNFQNGGHYVQDGVYTWTLTIEGEVDPFNSIQSVNGRVMVIR